MFAPRLRPHLFFKHRRPDDELRKTSDLISRAVRDEDFAIFRFTLGIPGIDDDEIPRVVGFLCTSLVLFNHVDSVHPSEAQTSTELIAFLLALACSTAPSLGRRLSEATPHSVHLSKIEHEVFALSQTTSDVAKADMAWATYALLTQTNAGGVLVIGNDKPRVLCARGHVQSANGTANRSGSGENIICSLTSNIRDSELMEVAENIYLSDRRSIDMAGTNMWKFLPGGTESVLMQLGNGNLRVVLFSEQPRAFSKRQRDCVAAIANKLCTNSY